MTHDTKAALPADVMALDEAYPALALADQVREYGRQCAALSASTQAPASPAVERDALLERIAQQWDGCIYHAVGEDIDIGASIRAALANQAPGEPT